MRNSLIAASGCAVLCALGVSACGGSDSGSGGSSGSKSKNVTIYSSLPLQGASRGNSEAVNNGAKLALAGGWRQGRHVHGHVQVARRLDGVRPASGTRARRSQRPQGRAGQVDDRATSGEFNSGATRDLDPDPEPGRHPADQPVEHRVGPDHEAARAPTPGEPEKYYPTGKRTYARVVPRDTIQGAAPASGDEGGRLQEASTSSTTRRSTAQGLATNVERRRRSTGIKVVGNDGIDPKARELPLAGVEDQGARARTASSVRHRRQQRRAAVQGRRSRRSRTPSSTARTASPRRRSPTRSRAASRRRSRRACSHGGDAARRTSTRRRARSSSRTTRRSTRQEAGAVRDLRLRGDVADARRDQACGRQRQRPHGGQRRRSTRPRTDSPSSARTDRQERRHHADRLRSVHDQGREARRSTRSSRQQRRLT